MILTSRRQACRRGIAALEMALVAPLLVFLLLGLWEIGRLAEAQQILSNAAREAGRQASTGMKDTSQVQQAALIYIQTAGLSSAGVTVTFTDMTNSGVTSPQTASQLDQLKITVVMPASNVRWLAMSPLFSGNNLTATSCWYSMNNLPINVSTTIPAN